jgi:hydroxyethylthiazole kinase
MSYESASRNDAELRVLAGNLLAGLRQTPRRIHVITNAAAQALTANLLLAAGAVPSLTVSPDEAPAFTARSAALVINLGTLDAERRASIPWSIATARQQHLPWVLDPVFVEASPQRLTLARLCLAGKPTVLRCNAAEFSALAGAEPGPDAVRSFAREHGVVVALTGPTDLVTDGLRTAMIANGDALMTRVTAMGCAGTSLLAAFAALHADAFEAAAAALLTIGISGEIAAAKADGPGTFQAAFLDALYNVRPSDIIEHARLT